MSTSKLKFRKNIPTYLVPIVLIFSPIYANNSPNCPFLDFSLMVCRVAELTYPLVTSTKMME